jgi:hypothetical protein
VAQTWMRVARCAKHCFTIGIIHVHLIHLSQSSDTGASADATARGDWLHASDRGGLGPGTAALHRSFLNSVRDGVRMLPSGRRAGAGCVQSLAGAGSSESVP